MGELAEAEAANAPDIVWLKWGLVASAAGFGGAIYSGLMSQRVMSRRRGTLRW